MKSYLARPNLLKAEPFKSKYNFKKFYHLAFVDRNAHLQMLIRDMYKFKCE